MPSGRTPSTNPTASCGKGRVKNVSSRGAAVSNAVCSQARQDSDPGGPT